MARTRVMLAPSSPASARVRRLAIQAVPVGTYFDDLGISTMERYGERHTHRSFVLLCNARLVGAGQALYTTNAFYAVQHWLIASSRNFLGLLVPAYQITMSNAKPRLATPILPLLLKLLLITLVLGDTYLPKTYSIGSSASALVYMSHDVHLCCACF